MDLYKTWLTCSTLVLAFSFSFSNTLKNLLEAIIYLFVVHPFDVGDGIMVGTTGTDYFKVHSQHFCMIPLNMLSFHIAIPTTFFLFSTVSGKHSSCSMR